MIDCLIIGQHDPDFEQHIRTLKFTFGKASGAYQDQDLTFIKYKGKSHRVMDMLNVINEDRLQKPLSNIDFMWPTIPILATYLDKYGHSFDYVNQLALNREELVEKLKNNRYRTIAITTTLYVTEVPIREIVEMIREYDKDVIIVLGGPYVMNRCSENAPQKLDKEFSSLGVDVLVNSSEGQMALVRVVEALKNRKPLSDIKNVIFRKELLRDMESKELSKPDDKEAVSSILDHFVFNPKETEDNTLSENLTNYALFGSEELGKFASLATGKSCPYRCSFCNFPTRYGDYKYLEVDDVEKQLNKLKDAGVETITFTDDTFNVPKKRFREILEMMIANDYGFRWNSFYRSDQGDEEVIKLMARSGCEGVYIGMETASDKLLKMMNKTSRRKHYEKAIPQLNANGIYTHANFIIGFPGETDETIQETLDFIRTYKPHTYKAQLWYADNLSPIWQKKEEAGLEGFGFNWKHNTMTSLDAVVEIDRLYEEIEESVFLPQEGFGIWCVFYLQRLGMERSQVLEYLKTFNQYVCKKRKSDGKHELSDDEFNHISSVGRITDSGSTVSKSLYEEYFRSSSPQKDLVSVSLAEATA